MQEPYCQHMRMQLVHLETGHSVIEADDHPELMDNLFRRGHGDAPFALMDETIETANYEIRITTGKPLPFLPRKDRNVPFSLAFLPS